MTIREVSVSVFEVDTVTPLFDLQGNGGTGSRRWKPSHAGGSNWWRSPRAGAEVIRQREEIHVLHVVTAEGVEGCCTVGDARYRTIGRRELAQLKQLVIGRSTDEREQLDQQLHRATRFAFFKPGWAGAFDNCLWDIQAQVAGKSVADLIGRNRRTCAAYYNSSGATLDDAVADSLHAIDAGFTAVKDHFNEGAATNPSWFEAVRAAVGDDATLMHDAAENGYGYEEAVAIGRALERNGFLWFEEPLADADPDALQRLCADLKIDVLAPETLMHERELCRFWLSSGAVDALRANARHGTTPLLALARLAQDRGSTVELNGPGGLFGLVHAHLCCAISNTRFYEYFPGGSRDEVGKEIGLLNPPVPEDGSIGPPTSPGWGAEWDWDYFRRHRVATW